MDVEYRLRKLESSYRHALSAAVAAKARYLAVDGESNSSRAAIERARTEWQRLESCKARLVAKMAELEELEREAVH
jgi:hypothetical protein